MTAANSMWIGAVDDIAPGSMDDERELFLKLFSGEVISAFEEKTIFLDKHDVRTISSGKSAQFPVFGRMPDAEYHTSGAEILGQDIRMAEQTIAVDRLLISHVFIPDIDEAIAHYEVRSKYSRLMGGKLATTFDNHIGRELILAATSTTPIASDTTRSGKIITDAEFADATAATKMQAWLDGLALCAQTFDEKYVPKDERYLAVTPAYFYFMASNVATNGMSLIHADYNQGNANGSLKKGEVLEAFGIKIIPFVDLPVANYSGEDFHAIDARNTVGIAWHPEAVGTVKLLDLSLQSQWDIRRQGTLMVARYAMGHDILRGECAIQLQTA